MTTDTQNDTELMQPPAPTASVGSQPVFWLVAWLSVALAGGVFGIIVGLMEEPGLAMIGLIAGFIIAGIYAVPIVATFGVLTWTLWLSRFAVITAAISGACTGILSSVMLDYGAINELVTLAGCIGGTVTGCITGMYWRNLRRWNQAPEYVMRGTWQFSLRDLFLRFTILSAVLGAWMYAITIYFKR